MIKLVVLAFIAFLFSCSDNKKIKKMKMGAYYIEGEIINDSTLHGPIKYFNSDGILVSEISYLNNQKNGEAINYYSNGKIQDQTTFFYGKENGFHSVYDSFGKIEYKDYSFFGKKIGPKLYFENGNLNTYEFANFEGQSFMEFKYDSLMRVKEYKGDFINMSMKFIEIGGVSKKLSFFIYTPSPPKIGMFYRIIKQVNDGPFITVNKIPTTGIYYETILDILPKNQKYHITLDIYDSSSNTKSTMIRGIDFE